MKMRVLIAAIVLLGLTVAGLAQGSPTRRCLLISGTGDGLGKQAASAAALGALADAVAKWQAEHNVQTYEATPWKPNPNPYWRSTISENLFLPPDDVTDRTYTICWKGVVSPAVCTSGTKVCW
ncbi:MAG: hypothetical protein ACR2J1_04100 [Methyloceanibacter sp.]|uniref:hypothetical protein n=1 Tax=Methyloceanibacter sp. TaxID=1965321 RepID=UPI003D9B8E6A